MKIFISADIEGTAGIAAWDETEPGGAGHWQYFREQMTREVAAACDGAMEGGATGVIVKDAHDSGRNIIPTGLPRGVILSRAWSGEPLSMVAGLDGSFDGIMFTGYHSAAHDMGNPLAHTMNTGIFELKINGERASEFMIHAYAAGTLGVKTLMLTGDKELCDKAKAISAGIVTVATSLGVGGASTSAHPLDACEMIFKAAKSAVQKRGEGCDVLMPQKFEIEITYVKHQMALKNSYYPGAKRIHERAVSLTCENYNEVLRAFRFIL